MSWSVAIRGTLLLSWCRRKSLLIDLKTTMQADAEQVRSFAVTIATDSAGLQAWVVEELMLRSMMQWMVPMTRPLCTLQWR